MPRVSELITQSYLNGEAGLGQLPAPFEKRLTDYALQVTTFGADRTGQFDSTLAFQKAIDYLFYLGGGTLSVPKGKYKVSGGIKLRSNIAIEGVGYPRIYTKTGTGYGHIFGKDYDNTTLENVSIRGLFIDQWEELQTSIQPNNIDKACNCISFYGRSKNITIEDNIFQSIGGWTISVTDSDLHYGSSHTYIKRNIINWKIAGTTWYDASAIYAESTHHVIEDNYIESNRPASPGNSRWRIEGGIESHGMGRVTDNTIINVQAGVNVVGYAYNVTAPKYEREISFNIIRGANRGIWLWTMKADNGLERLNIFNNDIEVIAEGYYAGFGAITVTVREQAFDDPNNRYIGYVKKMHIYNNKFRYEDLGYTGSEFFSILNTSAIHLAVNGQMSDVTINNNKIEGFKSPAISTTQYDPAPTRIHQDIEVYDNEFIDCGWSMSNTFQQAVLYFAVANEIRVRDNVIRWVNHNTTNYIVATGTQAVLFEYYRNEQVSYNGFTLTADNVQNKTLTTVIADIKNLGYRENAGSPVGALLPKKITDVVFDTTNSRYYVAIGTTNLDWRLVPKENRGKATILNGNSSIFVGHGLGVVPNLILITPQRNIGAAYVNGPDTTSTGFVIVTPTAVTQDSVVHWMAQV